MVVFMVVMVVIMNLCSMGDTARSQYTDQLRTLVNLLTDKTQH